eukprot:2645835-Pyramimonas_sp.AAC.1
MAIQDRLGRFVHLRIAAPACMRQVHRSARPRTWALTRWRHRVWRPQYATHWARRWQIWRPSQFHLCRRKFFMFD